MDQQTGLFLIGYLGLLLPAVVGFFWTERWLYGKKDATRHWLYVSALLVLMASVAFFFQGGSAQGTFFAVLLTLSGSAIGAVLGGIFGQFFVENHQQKNRTN